MTKRLRADDTTDLDVDETMDYRAAGWGDNEPNPGYQRRRFNRSQYGTMRVARGGPGRQIFGDSWSTASEKQQNNRRNYGWRGRGDYSRSGGFGRFHKGAIGGARGAVSGWRSSGGRRVSGQGD